MAPTPTCWQREEPTPTSIPCKPSAISKPTETDTGSTQRLLAHFRRLKPRRHLRSRPFAVLRTGPLADRFSACQRAGFASVARLSIAG
jgi:hypothetical protein